MMDASSDDPIKMIAMPVKGMMADRRGRFLNAACGGDVNLRAEVEARLGDVSKNDGTDEQPSGALADQVANPELDSIESIALEALSEVPGPNESRPAESKIDAPEHLSIGAYCDQKQLDTFARLRLFQKACRAIDQDHQRGLIHGGLTPKHTHGGNFAHLRQYLPLLDQGISALVEDIYARGLDHDVTVVIWGEFGRTPKVNKQAGRDHWARVNSALLSGGGMKVGQVIGATDKLGASTVSRPIHFRDVLATIYHNLGIEPDGYIRDKANRPVNILPPTSEVIRELT